jgi:hypothetical protein
VPAGIADALDAVKQIALALAVQPTIASGSHPALHPGRTAEVRVHGTLVGVAGELLPSIAAELDLPRVVALVELDLDLLIELGATEIAARPIGTLPAATQDLSLVVPIDIPAGEVRDAVVEGAGELLESARLVDDYRGKGVPEGSKSVTLALRFRAADRTLTAAEATEAKLAGAALAAKRFGATIASDVKTGADRSAPVVSVAKCYFLPAPSRPPSRSPAISCPCGLESSPPSRSPMPPPELDSSLGAAAGASSDLPPRNWLASHDRTIGATIGSTCLMMSPVTSLLVLAPASLETTAS